MLRGGQFSEGKVGNIQAEKTRVLYGLFTAVNNSIKKGWHTSSAPPFFNWFSYQPRTTIIWRRELACYKRLFHFYFNFLGPGFLDLRQVDCQHAVIIRSLDLIAGN